MTLRPQQLRLVGLFAAHLHVLGVPDERGRADRRCLKENRACLSPFHSSLQVSGIMGNQSSLWYTGVVKKKKKKGYRQLAKLSNRLGKLSETLSVSLGGAHLSPL